jgi:two-component system response regulator WspF
MLKVAIVNDSPMAAESLRRVVESVPDYKLAWIAANGREAIDNCGLNRPDIILMDLIMPEMDGVEATRRISTQFGCAILVVTATVNGHAGRVFEAMGGGALDAVNTPLLGSSGHGEGREILIRKIDAIATLLQDRPYRRSQLAAPAPQPASITEGVPLIAIGASTGGPSALKELLQAMPPNPGAAIAIVQHVDEQFAASFIDWLNQHAPLPVAQAKAGEPLETDKVVVCGRQDHLVLTAEGLLGYTADPKQLAYRPSVDVFFQSLAKYQGNQTVGVLLTGMGKDGAAGLKSMRERGWLTIAQDRETSAVYGMPKAAKELDAAEKILPLQGIWPALAEWARRLPRAAKGQREPE